MFCAPGIPRDSDEQHVCVELKTRTSAHTIYESIRHTLHTGAVYVRRKLKATARAPLCAASATRSLWTQPGQRAATKRKTVMKISMYCRELELLFRTLKIDVAGSRRRSANSY